MAEVLEILSTVYEVGKWAYTQFNTMKENREEAQELAGRILRLSGVAHSLKTQLQSGVKPLTPNIPAHMMHVEAFFVQLEAMLQARNPKLTLSGGFLNKCKALFAKVKEFFGAESWRDQLVAANDRLSQVLGDFEKAIVAENLMISINIQAVVEGIAERISDDHKAILDVKGALQQQHELLLQGSKGISRIEAVQQQLLQQEQQLHNQVLQQLQQLPQYKDVQRIETLQKQLLQQQQHQQQQQQQHHEQLLKRLQQLEQQHEHADGSNIQEMMQELHAMMQQQQQHQEHATSAQGRSDVSELKGMIQELLLKLHTRSMARGSAAPAAASKELRGMRTFTTSDITIIELIGDGGNSDVYLAQCRFFPGHIVYKKCSPPQRPLFFLCALSFCCTSHVVFCSEIERAGHNG